MPRRQFRRIGVTGIADHVRAEAVEGVDAGAAGAGAATTGAAAGTAVMVEVTAGASWMGHRNLRMGRVQIRGRFLLQ